MMKHALLLGYDKYKDSYELDTYSDELEEGGAFDFDDNCNLISRVPKKNKHIKMIENIFYYSIIFLLILLTYYCFTIKME